MISKNRRFLGLLALIWVLGPLQACIGTLYHSIKDYVDIRLDPQERDQLKTRSEILAIHHVPWASLPAQGEASRYSPIPQEDPLRTVKERFLAAVVGELGLTNVRAVAAPRLPPTLLNVGYAIKVSELVRVFGHGYVIDFQTIGWALTVYGDEKWWQFYMTTHYAPALLAYRARARLIDLDL